MPVLFHPDRIVELVVAVLFGLMFGSFLNVFVYRWPQIDESLSDRAERSMRFLALPLSFCPQCKAPIKPWHNIPVVSYLILRGRCADCNTSISIQYPAVELLGALICLLSVHFYGLGLTAFAAVLFLSALLVISAIDLRSFLIADKLVLPLVWLGLVVNMDAHFATLREAVLGAVVGYVLIFVVRQGGFFIARKEVIGMGDAKLMAAAGAWLGFQAIPFVLFAAAVFGLLFAVPRIMIKGDRKRHRFIPFGPFLSAAAAGMLFWGENVRYAYLTFVGLQ